MSRWKQQYSNHTILIKMKKHVFRPTHNPPRIDDYAMLSSDAQKTFLALEIKYKKFMAQTKSTERPHSVDAASYYKSIYRATFLLKQESLQPYENKRRDNEQMSTTSTCRGPQNSFWDDSFWDDTNSTKQYCPQVFPPDEETGHSRNLWMSQHQMSEQCATDAEKISNFGVYCDNLIQSNSCLTSNDREPVNLPGWLCGISETPDLSMGRKVFGCGKKTLRNKRSFENQQNILSFKPSEEEIARDIFALTQTSIRPASPCMDLDNESFGCSQDHHENESMTDIQKPKSKPLCNLENFEMTETAQSTPLLISDSLFQIDLTKDQELNGKISDKSHVKQPPSLIMINSQDKESRPLQRNSDIWVSMEASAAAKHVQNSKAVTQVDSESLNSEVSVSMDVKDECEPAVDFDLNFFDSEENPFQTSLDQNEASQSVIPSSLCNDDVIPKASSDENNVVLPEKQNSFQHDQENGARLKPSSKGDLLSSKQNSCSLQTMEEDPLLTSTEKTLDGAQMKSTSKQVQGGQPTLKSFKRDSAPAAKRSPPLDSSQASSCGKRKRSSFKPPPTKNEKCKADEKPSFSKKEKKVHAYDHTDKSDGTVDYVSFLNLSLDQQRATLKLIETSSLTLSLLFKNDQALVNTFYSPQEKRKHSPTGKDYLDVWGILVVTATLPNKIVFLPVDTEEIKTICSSLQLALSNAVTEKIIPNFKDFLHALRRHFFDYDTALACNNVLDPVVGAWLLDPEHSPSSFSHLCSLSGYQCSVREDDWQVCLVHTAAMMGSMKEKLKKEATWNIFYGIEMKLVPLLACMEARNIKVNVEKFKEFSDILQSKMRRLEENIFKEAGQKFSLTSHVQLRQILYEKLQLDKKLHRPGKISKTSVTRMKSTCEASLRLMADVHPLPSLMLEYRQLQKLKSTYVEGLLCCVRQGSLSTHWDQTAAATGRLTSCQPNVQAIPKSVITITDYKANYIIGSESSPSFDINAREPFESNDGHTFLSADFQQIEFRILAHLSNDSKLLSMFWKPEADDIFKLLTSQWHGTSVDTVTSSQREQTKRVVYSVMYGVGQEKLSEYLNVKPDVSKDIMASFLRQFPGIESFTKKCLSYAEEYGYTETLCGRRRYFPNIRHSSPNLRSYSQRQAVNFCVQGSAADICKLAMLAVETKLKQNPAIKCRLLLQIHDELVWEIPDGHLQDVTDLVDSVIGNTKSVCGDFCTLQVPLPALLSTGKSWAHMKPIREQILHKL